MCLVGFVQVMLRALPALYVSTDLESVVGCHFQAIQIVFRRIAEELLLAILTDLQNV
jgi:hypothetical protein